MPRLPLLTVPIFHYPSHSDRVLEPERASHSYGILPEALDSPIARASGNPKFADHRICRPLKESI